MRITLDANILVRANTRAQGPARELLTLIGSRGPHTLVLSRHILSEVKRTLSYPRLQALYGLTEAEIQEHVELLQRVATIVEPFISEPIVRIDPSRRRGPIHRCSGPGGRAVHQRSRLLSR